MSQSSNVDATANFCLHVLGPARLVDANGHTVAGMGPGKPLAMLSYLAIEGPTRREELVALLWPDMPEDRARNAFRQTLHRVRGALGADVISAELETVTANIGDGLWCDAVEFQRIVAAEPMQATALYRGPFLGGLNVGAGPFEQWAESQRERFEAQYRGALANAVNKTLEAGGQEEAIEYARLLSKVAPLDANAAVLEAKVLVASGRRAEAISVLTQHALRIESELGSKPAAVVSTLLHRLVRDTPAEPGSTPSDFLLEASFVGRDGELGKLLRLWRGIEQRGATAVVTGAAGIGKTRLLRELTQRVSGLGPMLLLWGQERHGNRAIPYAALADALRPAVNAPGVAGASQHLLAEAARLLPEIRDQFNLPDAPPLGDDAARIRFFDGIAALIDAVAFEQPVCIVIEDMQHASRSSIELLHFLTQRLAKAPVLFLLSLRRGDSPDYVLEKFSTSAAAGPRTRATDGTHDAYIELFLEPLEDQTVERMVISVSTPGEFPADTLATLVAAAEGNPFRALDLVRRVRRGEPITRQPVELSQALWTRLQSCSPQEQRLFLACALLGRPASLRLLAAATHLAEPLVFDAAMSLEQRGLIVQQRGGIAPAHDLLAAIALEGTGSAGRALLAGWTADALVGEAGSSNAELAKLYNEAGQTSSAHKYARAAILDAAGSGAAEELDNLIALAASTATSNADRLSVQSLRTAVRGDARRLGSGVVQAESPRRKVVAEDASSPDTAEQPIAPSRPATQRPRASSPHDGIWRWMTARPGPIAAVAVIATLMSFGVMRANGTRSNARGTVLGDSVFVSERFSARQSRQYLVTGSIVPTASMREISAAPQLAWVAQLALPWINPKLSPNGRYVALEKIATQGTSVHVVSANERDTIPLALGPGDNLAAGWSPDERWLLIIHGVSDRGEYRSRLFAYSVAQPGLRVALDTAADHAIIDAIWSPTGIHVAWTARVGASRQQDIFVGISDGSDARNITNDESEEYHPTWSPDGEQVVFTSDRGSDAEIYSLEIANNVLRRLTFDSAQDDRAVFSPDGDFIAFESTRGGHVGVYAMPPLGGSARRLTPVDRNFALEGWSGRAPSYIAELRVSAPAAVLPGGSAVATASAIDQYGSTMPARSIAWTSPDNTIGLLGIDASGPTGPSTATIEARTSGFARIVATAGAWRADTAFTLVGDSLRLLSDGFESGLSAQRWISLGAPSAVSAPGAGIGGGTGLILRSGRQWESGILGSNIVPLRAGLTVSARVRAPFATGGQPGGFTIALVAAEARDAIDAAAPQFLKLVALSWLSQAGRLAYSADREFWSEAVRFARGSDWYDFMIKVEADGRVAFYVDGQLRRRSGIIVAAPSTDVHVQLWIGSRATNDAVIVDDVRVGVQ